jgi:hypothetical protein
MLYEGGLKKLTTTRYPVYPVMSHSVSHTGYVVGYVVHILNSTWEVENHKCATELAEEIFHKRKVGEKKSESYK